MHARSPAESAEYGSGAAGASRLGADLRAARERLGWSLTEVAAGLRIRYSFLLAIEEGRTADLPGAAYAIGFVRAYAASMGLDQDEVARRFRAEAGEVNRKTELEFPAPVPERGVPAGAVVLLGVVLAIGAYVGWYRMSGDRPGTQAVQQVPDRLAPLVPAAPAPSVTAGSGATPAPAPSATSPAQSPSAPSPPQPVPPSAAAAAVPLPSSPAPAPATPPASPPLPGAGDGHIVLSARSDSWVQLRDPAGKIVLNRVLRAGETYPVPPGPQLQLTTGNAGGLDLIVDGVTAPPLGGPGTVRRDVPLDPALIRDGKLPAQVAQAHPAARPASPPTMPAVATSSPPMPAPVPLPPR
ncbi:MAG: DUF4115 domain-containing protein [Acidisphaera sp.]|nr:DUF4115 domain-containing protein [Acidisphaera sp.]